jgi:penicillin amidase
MDGFIPFSGPAPSFNPKAGYIVTANHMIPENYGYKVGYEWAPAYRFQRIMSLLEAARKTSAKLTPLDMGKIQTDVYCLPASELITILRGVPDARTNTYAQLILNWNATLDRDSPAAALYEVWRKKLTQAVVTKAAPETCNPCSRTFLYHSCFGFSRSRRWRCSV